MPQRPRTHQVADESRRAFEQALPSSWIFRPQQPDYGIDGEVEVFDDAGRSTGLRFYVQLKATDGTEDQARSVTLTIEVARYYSKLDLPVLIVSYHARSTNLFARWIQELNPPDEEDQRETFQVLFEEAHRWTAKTPGILLADLTRRRLLRAGSLELPILLTVQEDNPQAPLRNALLAALSNLQDVLKVTSDETRALATIVIEKRRIEARLGMEVSRSMGVPENVSNWTTLAADALLLLALALGRAGQPSITARIALSIMDSSAMIEDHAFFVPLARYLARGHRMAEALELSEGLAGRLGTTWAAEAFRVVAFAASGMSGYERRLYELYLDRRISLAQQQGDPQQTAIALYNRGNHLRGSGRRREAIRDYIAAARTDSAYWGRDYFNSELAGLFFVLGRFKCAAVLYQEGLDKGADFETRPLLADALMFGGQYEKAQAQFVDYLTETKDLTPEWRLKNWALTQLTNLGITSQPRRQREALAHAESPETLDVALHLDALCGLAWFNKGVGAQTVDRRAATSFYLMTAICQPWDVEAWRNAFALSMDSEDSGALTTLIALAAYQAHGERFLEELRLALQAPPDKIAELIVILRSELVEATRRQSPRVIRLLGPESAYMSFNLATGRVRRTGSVEKESRNS